MRGVFAGARTLGRRACFGDAALIANNLSAFAHLHHTLRRHRRRNGWKDLLARSRTSSTFSKSPALSRRFALSTSIGCAATLPDAALNAAVTGAVAGDVGATGAGVGCVAADACAGGGGAGFGYAALVTA